MLSTKGEGSVIQIDLASFRKGIYFIEGVYFITVRSRDQIWTEKIIKF